MIDPNATWVGRGEYPGESSVLCLGVDSIALQGEYGSGNFKGLRFELQQCYEEEEDNRTRKSRSLSNEKCETKIEEIQMFFKNMIEMNLMIESK